MKSPYQGFPDQAIPFLKRLKRNNRREWFQPRKQEYEQLLVKPMKELIMALHLEYGTKAPELSFDPKKAIYRIYRDTRFSKDKTPYKTHIGAFFPWRTMSKSDPEAPGLYLQISHDEVMIAGGTWMPSSQTLRKIRESIQQDTDTYTDLIHDPKFKKRFGEIQGERLKKAPQGMDPNHPLIELLKNKQFYVVRKYETKNLKGTKMLRLVGEDIVRLMPLIRWLNKAARLW